MSSSSKRKQKSLTCFFAGTSRKRPRSDGSFRSRNGGSGFGVCPLCQFSFAWHVLESHASECTGRTKQNEPTCISSSQQTAKGTTPFQDIGNDTTTPTKALVLRKTSEITPSANSDEQPSRSNETRKPNTEEELTTAATATRNSNIVTPRLAPIFRGKKERNTKDKSAAPTNPLQLRPHSYEPIPGLFVYENFITEEEEALIRKGCVHTNALPAWKQCRFNGKHIGKRWGVHCNLRDRRVDAPEHPLPEVLSQIVFSKLQQLGLPQTRNFWPNEANAIDYRKNQGHWLKDHVDDRKLSKEPIANLSLAGDCYMTFRNVSKHRNLAVSEQKVLLKRRCLQVLTGKARYDFTHGIANADLLSPRRISITMRESPLTRSTKPSTTF